MRNARQLALWRRRLIVGTMGTTFAIPGFLLNGCNLGEFTTTSTVTLSGREVTSFLVRTALLTPIENAVNAGVDWFFNRFDDEDDDE